MAINCNYLINKNVSSFKVLNVCHKQRCILQRVRTRDSSTIRVYNRTRIYTWSIFFLNIRTRIVLARNFFRKIRVYNRLHGLIILLPVFFQ